MMHNTLDVKKKTINMIFMLMNISHLKYRKTHSTYTWTNGSRGMTNHSSVMQQKKMIIMKHAAGQHNLLAMLSHWVGMVFQEFWNFLNRTHIFYIFQYGCEWCMIFLGGYGSFVIQPHSLQFYWSIYIFHCCTENGLFCNGWQVECKLHQ